MGDVAVLRMRPASVGEKPPIVGIEVPGMALAEVDPCLVVIRHAREGEQPESTEGQRQDQDIPRPGVGMGERPLQGFGRLAIDGQRQDVHMATLPLGSPAGNNLLRHSDPCLGISHLSADDVQAGAGPMGESEVRVGRDGLVQGLRGAGPGGEEQIDALAVTIGRAVGHGREWQATAVEAGHSRFLVMGLGAHKRMHEPSIRDLLPSVF